MRFWTHIVAFRSRRAAGLLLVLALILFALSFAIRMPVVDQLDLRVTRGIQSYRSPAADTIAESLTFCGNATTLIVLTALVAAFLLFARRGKIAVMVLATLIGLPLDWIVKEIVGRPRPSRSLVEVLLPTVGLSFPSGHAMASVTFYGFLAFLAWVHLPADRGRVAATVALAVLPVLISLSRIYVGAHWLSDILGGWCGGLFCLVALAEIYRGKGSGGRGKG